MLLKSSKRQTCFISVSEVKAKFLPLKTIIHYKENLNGFKAERKN